MAPYRRPGAYTERVDGTSSRLALVRTDVAAFVGIAQQGPLDTPVPVESFRQFQIHFGDFIGAGYLAYSVKAFFENGGARCWVVRVASKRDDVGACAAALVLGDGTSPRWRIRASSPGIWGEDLSVRIRTERRAEALVETLEPEGAYVGVTSVAGFARGTHVRLGQPGASVDTMAVVAHVDVAQRRLYWRGPDPRRSLSYRGSHVGLDPNVPISVASVSYAIDVYRDARLLTRYAALSLIPESPAYGPAVVTAPSYGRLPVEGGDAGVPGPIVVEELGTRTSQVPAPIAIDETRRHSLTGAADGLAALAVGDFIGEPFDGHDDDAVLQRKVRGIRTLEAVDEVAIVAVPDIVIHPDPDPVYEPEVPEVDPCPICPPSTPPRRPVRAPRRRGELPPIFSDDEVYRVQAALIAHCEDRGDRFAVLDPPYPATRDDEVGIAGIRAWRSRFETHDAAIYYPWIRTLEPRSSDASREVPPSGHVIGQYAFHDRRTGVFRAPANSELVWLHDLLKHTSFGEQELLNDLCVNVLRQEAARGIRIMGARTLSSDPRWRYVPVRRLILMVKEVIRILSQWVVFEPNNPATRARFSAVLINFLSALWREGALAGATPEQAFAVRCDDENNPGSERANGRLLAEIAVAPVEPLEFVVVRVGVQGNQLNVEEISSLARAA